MATRKLDLTDTDRQKFQRKYAIGEDSLGDEVLIGLSYDESNRHAKYQSLTVLRRTEETADRRDLNNRHQRAMNFWRCARLLPDVADQGMTPEAAFEIGRSAWKAYAAERQLIDFCNMIGRLPSRLRLPALNGWLRAFDDEAGKFIKKATRYRYYVSRALITGAVKSGLTGCRIPAANLESLVITRLRTFLADRGTILDAIQNRHPDGWGRRD